MNTPENFGLRPNELLLLGYAEGYTTNTKKFQQFWKWNYGVDDPQKLLRDFVKRGFLDVGGIESAVNAQSGAALKTVLREHGLKVSGRKDDLIKRVLTSIPTGELRMQFSEQWYRRTEKGDQAVEANPHIPYIHSNRYIHDLDINSLTDLVNTYPSSRWRDLIWGHLNQQTLVHAKAGDWGLYSNTKHAMAEFVAEESRWRDALALLGEVIYYDLSGLGNGFEVEYFPETVEYLFPYERSIATIPPGILERVFKWAENGGIDEEELRSLLLERLQRLAAPLHLFTTEEVLQIIFLERNGNTAVLTEMYEKAEHRLEHRMK